MSRKRKNVDVSGNKQTRNEKMESGSKDYRFMTALERGLSVLRVFSADQLLLTNTEIAEKTGISKPSVSRITFTLMTLGYLKHEERTGLYSIGPAVLSLGYSVIEQLSIRDLARPFMQQLAKLSGGSVYLGAPDGLDILYIEACHAPKSMAINLGVGSRVPMAKTGMGRAYLAALSDTDLAEKLGELRFFHGSDWPEVETQLLPELEATRQRGFSMSRGNWIKEANSAGCTINRADGHPLYTINVGGLSSIITDEILENKLGEELVGVAQNIEQAARGILS